MRFQSGTTLNSSANLQRLTQSIPASFTVWKDTNVSPTLYRAESNLYGVDDINGTDSAVVIQAALDALTAGRTWKERVVLRGNFSGVNRTIKIPSYTIFELDGLMTLTNASLLDVTGGQYWWIVNKNAPIWDGGAWLAGAGNTQIEIVGGIYDEINNPANVYGIDLRKVTDSSVHGISVKNTGETGIAIEKDSARVQVYNNYAEKNGYDGIGCGGFGSVNTDIWFVDNIIDGLNYTPHNGITVEQEQTRIHVIGNTVHGCVQSGINLNGRMSEITSNICYLNGFNGINVQEQNSKTVHSVIVADNICYDNTHHGIHILADHSGYAYRINVHDNIVFDNAYGAGTYSGIVLETQGVDCHNNYCFDTRAGGSKTQEYGIAIKGDVVNADNCRVIDNQLNDNELAGIGFIGAPVIGELRGNFGYADDYQTQTGAWVAPSDFVYEGRTVLVYNSTAGQYRIYTYMNAGWRYVALT